MKDKASLINYYNKTAAKRDKWKKRNRFYHKTIENYYKKAVPEGSKVLELGCFMGEFRACIYLGKVVEIDISN